MSGEHARWDELRDARLGLLKPKMLWDSIERQPPDIGGSHTWVCGCNEYQTEDEKHVSLCNYHGGFEDALKAVADVAEEALAILNSTAYGYPQRVLQASLLLEQIRKDASRTEDA